MRKRALSLRRKTCHLYIILASFTIFISQCISFLALFFRIFDRLFPWEICRVLVRVYVCGLLGRKEGEIEEGGELSRKEDPFIVSPSQCLIMLTSRQ